MSLGKRMRRTTSLSELPPVPIGSDPAGLDSNSLDPNPRERQRAAVEAELAAAVEVAEFLRACGICKRGLGAGRDTFIYRGDAAFCSLECREKQMKLDKMKEKCSQKSMKSNAPPPKARPQAATGNSETVAAA